MSRTTVISALDPTLTLVTDSQDTDAIREHIGRKASGYDSFFVRVENGEYTEVWGFAGIVPYNSKLVTRVL